MKLLIPDLSKSSRAELQGSITVLEKLLKKKAAIEKKRASLREIAARVTNEIAAFNRKADEGDRDASTQLLAAQDQLARLRRSIQFAEQELSDLRDEMADAAVQARHQITRAHASVIDQLKVFLVNLLAPHCENRGWAQQQVSQMFSVRQLSDFVHHAERRRMQVETCEDAAAVLEGQIKLLTALLASEPILKLNSGDPSGGFAFPAYC